MSNNLKVSAKPISHERIITVTPNKTMIVFCLFVIFGLLISASILGFYAGDNTIAGSIAVRLIDALEIIIGAIFGSTAAQLR